MILFLNYNNEGETIPYRSIEELPDSFADVPKHGKEIALAAFDSAYSGTCKDQGDKREQCAFSIAWAAIKQKYEQDKDGKWTEKKAETQSILLSTLNPPTDRPQIQNGVWIPFMRDGMLAEGKGKDGKKVIKRITKEAIDKGYRSFLGKTFDGNHDPDISGRIIDVKREGEFAYFMSEGLSDETLSVMNSPAYRGVSQSSVSLQEEMDNVKELEGRKVAIVTWPYKPGCPIESGCGIPLTSTITDTENFSLYSSDQNIVSVIKGDTTTEYSKEQMKTMLKTMMDTPEMVDESMKKMMRTMMGDTTKSTIKPKEIMTEEIKPEQKPESDALLKSTLADFEVLKKENEALKSTITKMTEEATAMKEETTKLKADIPVIIDSTLKAHAAQIKTEQEYAKAQDELFSIDKDAATELMAIKPDIGVLKSTITLWKKTVKTSPAGVGKGTELNSTVDENSGITVGAKVMV